VFGTQDTCRFVLGFTLCGSIMRLWEFDRLGGVGSQLFKVNKDGQMFVSAVLGCCNYPCAGPAPLGIAVMVTIGITGVTQLRCASIEATQLGMGIGSAPKGARIQEPAQERWRVAIDL
jgi:hypothetical protein